MSDVVTLGPESLLGIPDGEDAQTLHDRLDVALRYLANWYKATDGGPDKAIWWTKIDQVRAKVEAAERAIDPSGIFPGNAGVALYNDAALAFPGLWRELTLSADTLPAPGLLDVAADLFDTVIETPGYIVTKAAAAAGAALGQGAKDLVYQAWPFLALAVVAGVVYFFRAPIARALQTGAA
jgi:hypothetical protein